MLLLSAGLDTEAPRIFSGGPPGAVRRGVAPGGAGRDMGPGVAMAT